MKKNKKLTIALVVGETSGDILGAGLIKTIKKLYPNSCFVGIAGPQMQDEGCEAWYQMEELSVMGIVEVFCKLRRILSIRRAITKQIIKLKPDIFIGIDAPDFNLDLEGKLKRSGIKTIHYVSPSVWAWKQKRVFKIKRNTDLILAFLPFEKVFYDKFNVPCQFIGHKMADDIPLDPDHNYQRERLNIPKGVQVLSILVGSRHAEVSLLTEPFLKAVQIIQQTIPNLHIIVPLVNEKRKKEFLKIKSCVAPDFNVQILDGQAREAMIASDVAILASGTVALECMLAKCPMVVGYKMKPFTFWLAKKLIKTPYVSLPNILSGKEIVPELLQNDCTPENLSKQAIKLLSSDNSQLKKNFLSLHNQIRCNADDQAAKAVLKIVGINDNEI